MRPSAGGARSVELSERVRDPRTRQQRKSNWNGQSRATRSVGRTDVESGEPDEQRAPVTMATRRRPSSFSRWRSPREFAVLATEMSV